jgi:fructokinase
MPVQPSLQVTSPGDTPGILLFGELLADCFPDREVMGGAPYNVARHIRGLGRNAGLDPVLVTRIGKDERGAGMLENLHTAGLAVEGIQQDLLRPSGQVRVSLNATRREHSFDILPNQAWDFIHADMARLIGLLYRPQWVYFGTLAQRGMSRRALRTLLQSTQAHAFLDLNLRDPWVSKDVVLWSLEHAEITKLNAHELRRITAMLAMPDALPRIQAERLIGRFNLRGLLVTEGDAGAWLLDAEQQYCHSAASGPAVEVVDSVGAGDAFSAVCLIGLMQDWPVQQTLDRAHRFAGEICRIRGAVPDSAAFYQPFIAQWQLAQEAKP